MNTLAVDTSSPFGAVGIFREGRPVAEASLESMETHSARLLRTIDYLLEATKLRLSDIELFGVTVGPGSFTGLRVGLATMKGFAWTEKKPLVGLNSLEILAANAKETADYVVPMMDARRKRVYGAVYQWSEGERIEVVPPSDLSAEKLMPQIPGNCLILGSGVRTYRDEILESASHRVKFAPITDDFPRGSVVVELAIRKFRKGDLLEVTSAEPVYLRRTEAEIQEKGNIQ